MATCWPLSDRLTPAEAMDGIGAGIGADAHRREDEHSLAANIEQVAVGCEVTGLVRFPSRLERH